MPGQIPEPVKKERLKRLEEAQNKLRLQMLEDYVTAHRTDPVWILVEQQKDGIANGHTEHYVETDIPTAEDLTGKIVPVLLESTNGKICTGKIYPQTHP